jgi:subtilisin family serine protease
MTERKIKSYKSKGMLLLAPFAIAVFAGVFGPAGQTFAEGRGPARKIVVFEDTFVNEKAQAALLEVFEAEELRSLPIINGTAVILPEKAVAALASREEVLRIDDDIKVHATRKPPWAGGGDSGSQPAQTLPWGVDRIDAEEAWYVITGWNVNVAVIDTGIDADHPDLSVTDGINFLSKSPVKPADPLKWDDDNGHGTHVAGIIAAVNNDIGVIGVAPDVNLFAVKVLDRNGWGYASDVIAGIDWAVQNGMHLANLSLGANSSTQSLKDACDAARDAGLILVAAAGNDGDNVDYPAAYDSVIAVAAVDSGAAVADFSSRGPEVDVAAPGVSVMSTYKDGGYATLSGTSMATPHVTGALALRLAQDLQDFAAVGDFSFYKGELCDTADDLPPAGKDILTGCGLVDAEEIAVDTEIGNDLP